MHKHGGDDAPPLAANQHRAGVVRAKIHQLIGSGTHKADVMRDHDQKYDAIDGHQHIGSRRDLPRGARSANWWRRRIGGDIRREKLRIESWGRTSHSSTLMHCGATPLATTSNSAASTRRRTILWAVS